MAVEAAQNKIIHQEFVRQTFISDYIKTLIANQHECTIKLWLNPLILNEKYLKSKQN
jgi:hypothetical protein